MSAVSGWQDRLAERIAAADGLDLRRARRRSPMLPVMKWSLGTMFALVLTHERRHIWQARQVTERQRTFRKLRTGELRNSGTGETGGSGTEERGGTRGLENRSSAPAAS